MGSLRARPPPNAPPCCPPARPAPSLAPHAAHLTLPRPVERGDARCGTRGGYLDTSRVFTLHIRGGPPIGNHTHSCVFRACLAMRRVSPCTIASLSINRSVRRPTRKSAECERAQLVERVTRNTTRPGCAFFSTRVRQSVFAPGRPSSLYTSSKTRPARAPVPLY